jgi:hypothetical protein
MSIATFTTYLPALGLAVERPLPNAAKLGIDHDALATTSYLSNPELP